MREEQALAGEGAAVRADRLVVEVELHGVVVDIGFAHEEIGAARGIEEPIRPLGVSGIRHDALAVVHAKGVRRGAARVDHRERPDRQSTHRDRHAVRELQELDREAPRDRGGAGKEDLHRRLHALAHAGRARDGERHGPAPELPVEDQERERAEVVAMQVREGDRADRRRIDVGPPHGDERGGPAVDEQAPARALEEQAGLEAAAAPEGVAGAEDVDLQVCDTASQARGNAGGCQEARRSSISAGVSAKSRSAKYSGRTNPSRTACVSSRSSPS